jgi:hypothetical protein
MVGRLRRPAEAAVHGHEETGLAAGLFMRRSLPRFGQVAEQVNVGAVMVPLKPAWNPNEVFPPGAMAPL